MPEWARLLPATAHAPLSHVEVVWVVLPATAHAPLSHLEVVWVALDAHPMARGATVVGLAGPLGYSAACEDFLDR